MMKWKIRISFCLIALSTFTFAGPPAANLSASQPVVIDPDVAEAFASLWAATDNKSFDESLKRLQVLRRRCKKGDDIIREVVFGTTIPEKWRTGPDAGMRAWGMGATIIKRLEIPAGSIARALWPYLGSDDPRVVQVTRSWLEHAEVMDRSPWGKLQLYSGILDAEQRGVRPVPWVLIHYLYERNPGSAMLLAMRCYSRKQLDTWKPSLWADHVVNDTLWKQEYGFLDKKTVEPAAAEQVRKMAGAGQWWQRMYAAALMGKHPVFRQEALLQQLAKDKTPAIQQIAKRTLADFYWEPALQAILKTDVKTLDALIAKGADLSVRKQPKYRTKVGQTFWERVLSQHEGGVSKSIAMLIQRGAPIEQRSQIGNTPLMQAAANLEIDSAKVLLQAGADINSINPRTRYNALTLCLNPSIRPNESELALKMAKLLVEHEAKINPDGKKTALPLSAAARYGRGTVVEYMLDCGAGVNASGPNGQTALMVASRKAVPVLLNAGAKINTQDKLGRTALMHNVQRGGNWEVQAFLKHKPDLNIQDNEGNTALHRAARRKFHNIRRLLRDAGADTTIKNKQGKTAQDIWESYRKTY